MRRRPPRSTRTDTLFPYTTLFRSRCVALQTDTAECGLDNGFNLLETALAPVDDGPDGLNRLGALAHGELADTLQALQADEACILNASQHPACPRDADWYAKVCVQRPIYPELRDQRGWHHRDGLHANDTYGDNHAVATMGTAEGEGKGR